MPRPGHDAVLLVTGFPSLYARKMLERILAEEPRALVYALVPPSETTPPEIDALPAEQRARVILVQGDPSAMDLGLSGAEFRQLSREVDRIHHAAHVGDTGADKATAQRANVLATGEILEFARACASLDCLVLHSTARVSGDRTGVVYEDDLAWGQTFASPADETRMRAEQMARRAMRDVPIAVLRPTSIVGDLEESDRLDGVYLLALVVIAAPADIAIPFPGKGETPLNMVPLDYVVKAAHAIGRHPASRGRTFHIADPSPLSARSVFDVVTRAVGRRAAKGHIPANLAKALLRTPGVDRFLRSPRAFVEQLTTPVRYDTRNTDVVLRESGITCPPFESYVGDLVALVQDQIKARQRRREVTIVLEAEVDDPLS